MTHNNQARARALELLSELENIVEALSSPAPAWSSERPTKPGWYWHMQDLAINGIRARRVCEIELLHGVLYVVGLNPYPFRLENASGEWAGPLTPPQEGGV